MKISMIKPALSSAALHLVAIGLVFISLDLTPTPWQPSSNDGEIIDAVTIDSSQVEQELKLIKERELQKQQELENQLAELEKASRETERKRQEEEQRLAELRKQQQQQEARRKAEELRLAEARQQQDELRKRQEEEERRRQEEAERKRQEELRLVEEAKRKQEAEAEQRRLAEQQRQQQAAQDRQDMNVINSYVGRIADAIEREFNTAGLPAGLSCIFEIRMIPGGDVVEARVVKSSGNAVFDSRAEIAVKRASPLPVPDNPRIFGKMREIRLTFAPN